MTAQDTDRAWLTAMPKAEIHVHIEGCFEADTLERWAQEAGVAMPRPKARLYEFRALADFLDFLDWASSLAGSAARVAELAYQFAERLARDGTLYADAIINPTHWHAWKGRTRALIDALDAGFTEAEQDGLPRVGLCVSLLRTQSAAEAADLVAALTDWRHPRIVALSVDGNEAAAGRTGPRFAEAFAKAGRAGFGRTVHAGESSGPEGVRDAIQLLGCDRIDHGVRAIEDAETLAMVVDWGIPLGVCPTSNLSLRVYPALAEHPVERLRQAGARVSLNTDDPSLLGTDLPAEYGKVAGAFGWDRAVLKAVARTSIEASFADPDRKAAMLARLAAYAT